MPHLAYAIEEVQWIYLLTLYHLYIILDFEDEPDPPKLASVKLDKYCSRLV